MSQRRSASLSPPIAIVNKVSKPHPPAVATPRVSSASFCLPPSNARLFAALGIVTIAESGWRHEIRRSWLPSSPGAPELIANFVLRGINTTVSALAEAAVQRDIIFLNASDRESKGRGPLHSTVLWLQCASKAWPLSTLVGKVEDDMWLDLQGVVASLRVAQAELASRNVDYMYWGMMEMYHMNVTTWRTMKFHSNWLSSGYERCRSAGRGSADAGLDSGDVISNRWPCCCVRAARLQCTPCRQHSEW